MGHRYQLEKLAGSFGAWGEEARPGGQSDSRRVWTSQAADMYNANDVYKLGPGII